MPEPKTEPKTTNDGTSAKTVEELTAELEAGKTTLEAANKRAEDAETKAADSDKKLQNDLYSPDYLQYLQDKENKGKTPPPNEKQPDFDSMKMGEIVTHIKKEVQSAISASQEATNTTINNLGRMVEGIIVSQDVDKAVAKYPDFYDYREAMTDLSKKQPQLSAVHLYQLAKFGKVEKDIKQKNTASAQDTHKKPEDLTKKEFKTTEEAATEIAEDIGL